MDSNYKIYDPLASYGRIDAILDTPSGNYEEVTGLPDRDKLTFSNGFYALCTALFIDIRDSSELPSFYKRPVLAKIYRAFISEMVAVFNSCPTAREINIVGDCVWGVYNTPSKPDVDYVFSLAAIANSLGKVLNFKLDKHGYQKQLRFGIGLSVGRALMIKAGYSGSGINDVIYMGDVVNQAAKLASKGSSGWGVPALSVDDVAYENLNDHNKRLLTGAGYPQIYQGNVFSEEMEEWYKANCI